MGRMAATAAVLTIVFLSGCGIRGGGARTSSPHVSDALGSSPNHVSSSLAAPPSATHGPTSTAVSSSGSSFIPEPSTGSSAPTETVALPVTTIPVTYAGSRMSGPSTATLTLPVGLVQSVGVYWVGYLLVLAPVKWTGTATVGTDGSLAATLHPVGRRGPAGPKIQITEDSACYGCGLTDSARYFSVVQSHWAQYGYPDRPPPLVPFTATDYLNPALIAYSLPRTSQGLEVNGVAYSGILAHTAGLTFARAQETLPPGEKAMATLSLNYFVGHDIG